MGGWVETNIEDRIDTKKDSFNSDVPEEQIKELLDCHNCTQEEWIIIKTKLNGKLVKLTKEVIELKGILKDFINESSDRIKDCEERLDHKKEKIEILEEREEKLHNNVTNMNSKLDEINDKIKDVAEIPSTETIKAAFKKNKENINEAFENNAIQRRKDNRDILYVFIIALSAVSAVIIPLLVVCLTYLIYHQ